MNENGYIKIVGRKKDMVIRGGENLYPLEIENFLHSHPAILEAQVRYYNLHVFLSFIFMHYGPHLRMNILKYKRLIWYVAEVHAKSLNALYFLHAQKISTLVFIKLYKNIIVLERGRIRANEVTNFKKLRLQLSTRFYTKQIVHVFCQIKMVLGREISKTYSI